MDTAEYRRYEGSDVARALFFKETIVNVLRNESYTSAFAELCDFYANPNLNQIIVSRMIDRITQYCVMKKFINWDYPILNEDLLKELFLLPFEIRTGSKLTRMIMKQYFPELLRFPTGRSPFSARYPLIMHQAYAKFSKRKISKGLEHLLPPLLNKETTDLKFDNSFIDNSKVARLLSSEDSRMKTMGQTRLLNLYQWMKYKEAI
jgi:hypothetical protein